MSPPPLFFSLSQFDTNGDGQISTAELREAMKKLLGQQVGWWWESLSSCLWLHLDFLLLCFSISCLMKTCTLTNHALTFVGWPQRSGGHPTRYWPQWGRARRLWRSVIKSLHCMCCQTSVLSYLWSVSISRQLYGRIACNYTLLCHIFWQCRFMILFQDQMSIQWGNYMKHGFHSHTGPLHICHACGAALCKNKMTSVLWSRLQHGHTLNFIHYKIFYWSQSFSN